MKALLLAAGFGTRLRPLTNSIPKCLVPIHGKPLLGYWFDLLFDAGIELAIVNTHYLPDVVNDFVASSPWRDKIKIVHERTLLGTGGTVKACRPMFSGEPIIVAHADNLSQFNVNDFICAHHSRPSHTLMTMMTFITDDPTSCGILDLDRDGVVQAMHEKVANPPGNVANGAVYILEPAIVDAIAESPKEIVDISTEILPRYFGKIATFNNNDFHRDIGTPESLRRAELEYSSN
jgi:mannose-1-phosphate guanylyltransferase